MPYSWIPSSIFSGKYLKMEKEFDTFSKIGYDQKTLYKMMNSFAKIKEDTKVWIKSSLSDAS